MLAEPPDIIGRSMNRRGDSRLGEYTPEICRRAFGCQRRPISRCPKLAITSTTPRQVVLVAHRVGVILSGKVRLATSSSVR